MSGIWGYLDGKFTRKELFSWLSTCMVFEIILMATLPGKSCFPGSPHVWCFRLSWWQLYRERAVLLALHMCGVWGYLDSNFTGKELFSWLSTCVVFEVILIATLPGKKLFSWFSTCVVFKVILMATLPGKSCSPGSPHVWCFMLSWWQLYRERAVLLALHMCGVWGYLNCNFTRKELFSWLSTCLVFDVILTP